MYMMSNDRYTGIPSVYSHLRGRAVCGTPCRWIAIYLAILAQVACAVDTPAEDVSVCAPPSASLSDTFRHQAMSCEFMFVLYAPEGEKSTVGIRRAAGQAFEAIDALEARISSWIPSSQISRINRLASAEPVKVAPTTMNLLLLARDLHSETDGVFDISVGPLLKLWGFYRGKGALPSEADLDAAISRVGLDAVEFDAAERTVHFTKDGMRLDMGGIGKGAALDVAADVLLEHGVSCGILSAGTSTILAMDAVPGEKGWRVKIRHPYDRMKDACEVWGWGRVLLNVDCDSWVG